MAWCGPAFFNRCALVSHYGPHVWIRNTDANHGNVFVGCTFETTGGRETVITRSPANHGKTYPYCEAVLIDCALADVSHRHPASRQLTLEHDAEIIANYSDPAYVLGGWMPVLEDISGVTHN